MTVDPGAGSPPGPPGGIGSGGSGGAADDDPFAGSLFLAESAVVDSFSAHSSLLGVRERLAARNALGVAYCAAERYAEGAELLAEVVRLCTDLLGPEDADTLAAAGNLGVALAWTDRFDEALPLLEHVLGARERVLGDEHPATLAARDALAVTYRLAERLPAAVALHLRVAAQRARVLGPAHPDTLTSRSGLALAYLAADDGEAAASVLSAALVDAEREAAEREGRGGEGGGGVPSLAVVYLRANLGRCLTGLGRPASAQPLLSRAFHDAALLLGVNHPDCVLMRRELAQIGGPTEPDQEAPR